MLFVIMASPLKRRKLPQWMLVPKIVYEEEEDTKAVADAKLAIDILQAEEDAQSGCKDWGFYDYLGQEKEEDEEFNLDDSDVMGSMSTDEALAVLYITKGPNFDARAVKNDRALLLHELRAAIMHLSRP